MDNKYTGLLGEEKGKQEIQIIKDEERKVLVANGNIKKRWKSYFHKPFNEKQATSIDMKDLAT